MIYEKEERKPQIWLCGGHFINDIYTGILNPIMPFIAEKVAISMTFATFILSCSHIFASIFQPFFGYFADKMRKRALIFWGLIFTAVFLSFAPTSTCPYVMILFIILGSLGSSLYHPQALGLVPKFSTSNVAKNMGIFIATGTLGFSLGPLVSAAIAQYLGLEKMPVMCFLGVFWALMMFKMVPKFSTEQVIKTESFDFGKAFSDILKNRKLDILIIISILKSLMQTSCSMLLPFLWQRMHYSKIEIGVAMFCFLFAGGIASFLSPKVEKKIGTKNVFYISMILPLPIIGMFAMTYKTIPLLSFAFVALTGFVVMFAVPVMMSMAQKILPQYKSIIGGFINGFSWGVVAIIITMVSHIADTNNCIVPVILIISTIPAICSFMVKKLFTEQNA